MAREVIEFKLKEVLKKMEFLEKENKQKLLEEEENNKNFNNNRKVL